MFSFDQENATLNFLTAFFEAENEQANLAIFEVKKGDLVGPGTRLGVMVFNGGKRIPMLMPAGISGEVAALNGQIDYEFLHEPPAQFALRLVRKAVLPPAVPEPPVPDPGAGDD